MKPIRENVVIQIEVTNACHLSCANCSRFVGHHKRPFYMKLSEVEAAIRSLDGFEGRIGLMGGEPALHPNFPEICDLFGDLIPDKRRREFWTSGYKWEEYRKIREATFDRDLVHYNDHSKPDEGWHQPLLISIDEMVDDKQKMWTLINNCWVQRRWSASITPKGAFFCEVAAALHHAMDGPNGWPVEPGWWRKLPADYEEQKRFACLKCSAALPLDQIPNNHSPADIVSESNLSLLKANGSPKAKAKRVTVIMKPEAVRYLESQPAVIPGERGYLASHPDWRPSEFRTKIYHEPGEGKLAASEVRQMQRKGETFGARLQAKGIENQVIANHRNRKIAITKETILSASLDLIGKEALLEPLVGIEFESVEQLSRSLDEWAGSAFSVRDKDMVLKHIFDPIPLNSSD